MRIRSLVGDIVIAALVLVAALFLYAVFDIGLFYSPWPWQSPREQDRAVHPSGFSIIKPWGWVERIHVRRDPVPPDDSINLLPNSKTRITPSYHVRRLTSSPDTERMKKDGGYSLVKFQGKDAIGREAVSGQYWVVERFFERNGSWYSVTLLLPDEEGSEIKVSAIWWSYLESFRTSQ